MSRGPLSVPDGIHRFLRTEVKSMIRRCILSALVATLLVGYSAMVALGQPTPYGDQYTFSGTNFPNSFGVVKDPEFQVVTDHGTPPVTLTFDGIPEAAGGMIVNERAIVWPGFPGGFTAVHANLGQTIDLVIWENPGEVIEFSFATADSQWISDDPGAPSAFSVAGLDWPHATPGTMPTFLDENLFGQGAFYFYFSNDGVPLVNMAIAIDTGIVVGEHPFDPNVPEVAYILYSNGQINDVTDSYEGGLDFNGGTSQLDADGELPDESAWSVLSTIMSLGPTPGDAFHIGFLVDQQTEPVIAGDFNGDTVVDNADFAILRDNFQSPGGFTKGDINFDGFIDLKDFVEFKAVFNAGAAVPEPATMALFWAGTAMLGLRRRRVRN